MKSVWLLGALLLWSSGMACAAPAGESSATSAVWAAAKLLVSLLIVIGAIFAAAWALKRIGPPRAANRLIRVLGSVPVGPRERLVLVEIGETWFVLGVAQGNIQTLHSMPKQAGMFDAPPVARKWLERWRA